ncbi:hypothetical protein, partial [Palleronia abyssalis]|uniref:hypothetical protein n=1 Tax=Palleronia abyssalis TaxID=1501240 RepID=UPI001C63B588
TSTCRSFATISSGLCLFWGILASSNWPVSHTSGRTTFQGADHCAPLGNRYFNQAEIGQGYSKNVQSFLSITRNHP